MRLPTDRPTVKGMVISNTTIEIGITAIRGSSSLRTIRLKWTTEDRKSMSE